MKYTVMIERGATSFGAYVPDLPGCVATLETRAEALEPIEAAMEFHLEGLRKAGLEVPQPISSRALVAIWWQFGGDGLNR